MFEDIFQGIMCILSEIGLIVCATLTRNGYKIGNYELYDDTVTSVNPDTRNIDVSYIVGETSYSYSYSIPKLQDMPEVDLQVNVMTYSEILNKY
ncbi:MAG: hypothetical protein K2O29_09560 [Ruminococcus sp.]|nr:hypothetical protein [Ruminococcus sp.]MDE7138681.1 hypothetical protein [Ruminococcus sp.]